MVFNVKKLVDSSVDLQLQQKDGKSDSSKMSGRYCGFMNISMPMSTKSFGDNMYSLWSRGSILRENRLSTDLALAHTKKTTQHLFMEFHNRAD
jgi:hypothetical protein